MSYAADILIAHRAGLRANALSVPEPLDPSEDIVMNSYLNNFLHLQKNREQIHISACA
jgi:hypothetical protein